MKEPVVVGYCSGEQVDARFNRSLVRLIFAEERIFPPDGGVIHIRSGPRVAAARNAIVRTFLTERPNANWLLMLDSDMVFEPDLVDRLLNVSQDNDVKIVGGLCFGGGYTNEIFPTMYMMEGENIGPIADIPEDKLVRVDGTGAACLLVHRSVYDAMIGKFEDPHQWFAETIWHGKEIGEDLSFCLRAKLCGFDTYVHTGIQVGHARTKVLGINDWNDAS